MHTTQLIPVLVAAATWIGFAVAMRTYFRHADQRSAAKSLLTLSAFVCAIAQIIVIACAQPAGATWLWLGIASYAWANVIFWWALRAHGKLHPAFALIEVPPSTLTTAGPYRLIRHPIYAAYLLAWCAGAIIVAQPWLLLAVAFMGMLYATIARREERGFLASEFGSAYREYMRRTGMFFPKLSRPQCTG
jgi:protein-S-isoprenylcysteine O-methyltransferase Ste14